MIFQIISGPSCDEIVAGTHDKYGTYEDYSFRLFVDNEEVDVRANIQLAGLISSDGDYVLQIQLYSEEDTPLSLDDVDKAFCVQYNANTGNGHVLEGVVPVPIFYGCG